MRIVPEIMADGDESRNCEQKILFGVIILLFGLAAFVLAIAVLKSPELAEELHPQALEHGHDQNLAPADSSAKLRNL